MAMLDHDLHQARAPRNITPFEQGELFTRLKLQPLPLYKHGPEDELNETRH